MSDSWKTRLNELAIAVRWPLSRPLRTWRMRQKSQMGQAPLTVLFYHRVSNNHPNPWTIDCQSFEDQIHYVRRNFEIISIAELQRRVAERFSPRPAVAITFDDGYGDNCKFALPLLIRHNVPCTYYVTTQNVLQGQPFAHDLLRDQPLAVNTMDEIRAAADAGIEIGLHTANHVDFSQVETVAELQREIMDAKAELEVMIDRPVRSMAVPYGRREQMRPCVFETARAAGLTSVCSAYGGYNQVGDDPFHVRRFHGDRNLTRVKNWLHYDPRHLAPVRLPREDCLLEQLVKETSQLVSHSTSLS